MPAAVVPSVVAPEFVTRRFQLPDLDHHGKWLTARFLQKYRHLTQRELVGFLRGIIYVNEYLFLFQPRAVALAQLVTPTLAPRAVVQEHFVWVEDPGDKNLVEQAADFYVEFERWAVNTKHVDTIIVAEASDVPAELIKTKLPRLHQRQQIFAKVGGT